MEWIFIILFIWLVYLGGFGHIFGAGKAGVNAALGKGSLKENLELELKGMGPLELRGIEKTVGEGSKGIEVIELEIRGLFPISKQTNLAFVTSVFDVTDNDSWQPVVSTASDWQEADTNCYQHKQPIGSATGNQGYGRWIRAGVVIKDILRPPHKGERKLKAYTRLVDADNLPTIKNGFGLKDEEGVFWYRSFDFSINFKESGWLDQQQGSREAAICSVQLAVAVAMIDRVLKDGEGQAIKNWIVSKISAFSGSSQVAWKNDLNNAFKSAYEMSLERSMSLSTLTQKLSEIGETSSKFECIDLLYDIVGAEGVVEPKKRALVKKIAQSLNIDEKELEQIADQKLISVSAQVTDESDLEGILEIDSTWDQEKVRRHLRDQFQKWNNRVTTLTDEAEKRNAQRMLDLIAKARTKYS